MTKSNNEWVPEIGEVAMGSWVDDDGTLMDTAVEVSAYHGEKVWVTCCSLDKVFRLTDIKFRPLKTEAEKRRDEAVAEMKSLFHKNVCLPNDVIFEEIHDAGWIKPKPLNSHDLKAFWNSHGQAWSWDLMAERINSHIRGEDL